MISKKCFLVTVEYDDGDTPDVLPNESFLFDNERTAKAFAKKVNDHPADIRIRYFGWIVIMQDVKQATALFDKFLEDYGYEIDPIEELLSVARSTDDEE